MFTYPVSDTISLALPRPAQDAEPLFALVTASRAQLLPWLPWVPKMLTAQDEAAFLTLKLREFGQRISLTTVIRRQDQVVGMLSLNGFHAIDNSADIGYWLGSAFVGHGIMHTALGGLINIGFHDYGLNKVTLQAAIDNPRSNHVAANAGFHLDGVLRASELLTDGYHDEKSWSLLRSEWTDQTAPKK